MPHESSSSEGARVRSSPAAALFTLGIPAKQPRALARDAAGARAFVLMQYFGYLRRNPDDPPEPNLDFAGYNFWLGKLNEFNGNFVEAEMVKAFITSIEYRRRFGQP